MAIYTEQEQALINRLRRKIGDFEKPAIEDETVDTSSPILYYELASNGENITVSTVTSSGTLSISDGTVPPTFNIVDNFRIDFNQQISGRLLFKYTSFVYSDDDLDGYLQDANTTHLDKGVILNALNSLNILLAGINIIEQEIKNLASSSTALKQGSFSITTSQNVKEMNSLLTELHKEYDPLLRKALEEDYYGYGVGEYWDYMLTGQNY